MKTAKRQYYEVAKNILVLAFFFALNNFGVAGNVAFYALLIWLMFAKGPEWAIKAVSLSMLVLVANSSFVDKTPVLGIMKFVIIFLALFRLSYALGPGFFRFITSRQHYLWLTAFTLVSALFSVINNYFLTISLLKLTSFFVGVSVIILAAQVAYLRKIDLASWFLAIIVFSVGLGLLAYVTGNGFNAKTELMYHSGLFNGPFYHPQTLGPAAALMSIYVVALMLYGQEQPRFFLLLLLSALLAFLYMSSARTGLLGFVIGCTVLVGFGLKRRRWGRIIVKWRISKLHIFLAGLALLLSVSVLEGLTSTVSSNLKQFLTKGRTDSLALEELAASRESQFIVASRNFENNPLIGIGFGTSTDPRFNRGGSLLSAPTEKGFLPLAVLEETGMIGTTFFTIFVISFFWYFWRRANIVGIALFAGLLGVNLGEMNFFSFGGQGGFMWVIVCGGIILGGSAIVNPLAEDQAEAREKKRRHRIAPEEVNLTG